MSEQEVQTAAQRGVLQQLDVHLQVRRVELGQAVLAGAEEAAGAALLQVDLGNLEAVGDDAEGLEPRSRVGVFAVGHQQAAGLQRSPAHPSPELMELVEAGADGVFNDHQ